MEWGLLNKIWATANVRYSVIVVFSLEDIGCCYKCRFVKHEPFATTQQRSFWQPFPFVLRYCHREKTGRERTQIWQSWHQAANAHYFIRRLFFELIIKSATLSATRLFDATSPSLFHLTTCLLSFDKIFNLLLLTFRRSRLDTSWCGGQD